MARLCTLQATMADEAQTFELDVDNAAAGMRLDRFIATRIETLSRARVQGLIARGHVRGERGTLADGALRVKPGMIVWVEVPPPAPAEPVAEAIALTILYEDDHLLVLDKPPGLVVHPAAGHATGTLVNALLAHCGDSLSGIGGVRRPGIVHRLDKDTSGLLVVAKTDVAHAGLSEQFAAHGADGRLLRTYVAVVWGTPERQRGTIDADLQRSASDRTKIAVVRGDGGRRAVTHYEVLERYRGREGRVVASLCRVQLETGRTHQIRVHFAHIGHPVLGDRVYGGGFAASAGLLSEEGQAALRGLGRQALHAERLGFEHPVSGDALDFTVPPPPDLQVLIDALRAQDAADAGM